MADDDEEEREPVVELGDGPRVEGAPLARVSSRLTWGIEKSRLETREGNTEIRTPEGPKRLGDVLGSVEKSYFTRRQDFEDTIEGAVGTGPIPTAEDEGSADTDSSDTDGTDTEGENGDDTDLRSGTDAEQGTDTESRAKTQGEAHAETSSATDSESASEEERTDAEGDDAGSED